MTDRRSSIDRVSLDTQLQMTCYRWAPEGAPRAGVLLLHGFGEHAGRYEELGSLLASQGYLVIAPDQRGHGQTTGKRGHVKRFDEYSEDLDALWTARELEKQAPLWFLVGHSMGGLVALRYALRQPKRFRAMVVSNPLLGLAVKAPKIKVLIGNMMSSILPGLTLGNEIDPSHLSTDQAVGRAYVADPLVHARVSTRWFTEMTAAVAQVHSMAPSGLSIPTLFQLSDGDKIVAMPAAKELYERLQLKDRDIRIYPGLYHEIFNEFDRQKVFSDLSAWLEGHLGASRARA